MLLFCSLKELFIFRMCKNTKFDDRLNLCVDLMKDGVVLGADTRATSSEVVADKMCAKIHHIAPNI